MVRALEGVALGTACLAWIAGYGLFLRAVARGRFDTTGGE